MPPPTMQQLVILSGKGGTGKTSISAAFAHLAHDGPSPIQVVLVDADVDAANLELALHPTRIETHDFTGGSVAIINSTLCQNCGVCQQVCRFDAIHLENQNYKIDPIACDGCAACVYQCPEGAIRMLPQIVGQWYRSESPYGPLFHAGLRPAQENSGKLVTTIKQNARLLGLDRGSELVIVDGPPGIGCPVISAIAGADIMLIVAEPTFAGIHDMDRLLQLAHHFRMKAVVCINKADIYPAGAHQIVRYCVQNRIEIVGSIPFDERVTLAMMNGEPITVHAPTARASVAINQIWGKLITCMFKEASS